VFLDGGLDEPIGWQKFGALAITRTTKLSFIHKKTNTLPINHTKFHFSMVGSLIDGRVFFGVGFGTIASNRRGILTTNLQKRQYIS